jgi:hypothetical protein
MTPCLALILAAALGSPNDAASLVAGLGSPRYADREAAARALQALGRDALPALRAARDTRDAEVRVRAAALAERIEAELMVRPTLVRLDFQDRPLIEIADELGRRAGMPIVLDPAVRLGKGARRLTVSAPEPVAAWEAVDRLCLAAGLSARSGSNEPPAGFGAAGVTQEAGLLLADLRGGRRAPTFTDGPFRVKLLGSHYQRDRSFEPAPGDPAGPLVTEQFQLQMELMVEPRMTVALQGSVKLIEAVDDLGQSLLAPGTPPELGLESPNLFAFGSGSNIQSAVYLSRPERPGRTIRRLRGVMPLAVASRKADPLVVPLAGAAGKTFVGDDATLIVHSLRTDPNDAQLTLEMTVMPPSAADSGGPARADLGSAVALAPDFLEHQVEVADANGKPFVLFPLEVNPRDDGVRMTLLLAPGEGATGPAQLRFFGLIRAAHKVVFEFADVEMP